MQIRLMTPDVSLWNPGRTCQAPSAPQPLRASLAEEADGLASVEHQGEFL